GFVQIVLLLGRIHTLEIDGCGSHGHTRRQTFRWRYRLDCGFHFGPFAEPGPALSEASDNRRIDRLSLRQQADQALCALRLAPARAWNDCLRPFLSASA